MNRTIAYSLISLLLLHCVGVVLAEEMTTLGAASMDALCRNAGYSYGVADWQHHGGTGWELKDSIAGWTTSVTGEPSETVTWTADPAVSGVTSNGEATAYAGGTTGQLIKGLNHKGNVQRVTLCMDEPPIPEFGLVAAGLVMLAGIGVLIWRRS